MGVSGVEEMSARRENFASWFSAKSSLPAMRARVRTAILLCLPALLLGLVFSGCDSAGLVGPESDGPSEGGSTLFQKANDLEARITGLRKTVSLARSGSAGASSTDGAMRVALASVSRVAPPQDTMQVGALTHADGTIFIGYKTPGPAFGGGLDRLDASNPTTVLSPSSLGSDDLDIEDVVSGADDEPLYVTGGIEPSAYDGDLRGTPASLLKITGLEAPRASVTGLAGPVGRSVVAPPEGDGVHAVYATSGEETLYRFDAALANQTTREVSGARLGSVAAGASALFAADQSGGVYSGTLEGDGSFGDVSGLGDEEVEQLQARHGKVLDGERLFLALGSGGLAVLDATSGEVLFRRYGPSYVSVTLHENDPEVPNEPVGLVYAARPDGHLDVYRVNDEGLTTGDSGTGLADVGTIDLGEIMGISSPVQNVVGAGCHVYAASNDDGVVAMELATTQGCGTGGHQLPAASDDTDETSEREATTTDVLANDADPDGELDASTVQVESASDHGTVEVDEGSGVITYTPNPGFTGTDEYTYTVSDEDGWTSNEATVTITVTSLTPPPPPGG